MHDRAYYESKFFDWLSTFQMKMATGERFVAALQNFANNDDLIETHNKQNSTYTLGHNQFSHMTVEEWREYVKLGLKKDTESKAPFTHSAPANLMALQNLIKGQSWYLINFIGRD